MVASQISSCHVLTDIDRLINGRKCYRLKFPGFVTKSVVVVFVCKSHEAIIYHDGKVYEVVDEFGFNSFSYATYRGTI